MGSPLGIAVDRHISKELMFAKFGYYPHPKQELFHRSQARFRLPVCGRRFGKSKMSAMDMLPELFVPDRRYWIVGPTYDLGEREFRVIWDALKLHRLMGPETDIKGVYNRTNGKMWIQFPWNTRLEVRSADHPESLVGDSLHGVIMSEAAKQSENTWSQYIRPALTDYHGWATFPTTPEGTANWIYDLWRMGQDPEEAEYESWQFPSWSNPFVYPKGEDDPEILSIKRETATPIFLQEYGASFAAFQGQIYPEFDEKIHVKPITYNPDWPNYIAWDFGFTNPLAAVEFQVDPMDRVFVWREHYATAMTIDQHVEVMKNRRQPPGYKVDLMFGDSADPEAIAVLNQIMAPTVGDPLAKSNWREGVGVVKRFLLPRDAEAAPGTPGSEPSLFIDNKCEHTVKEHINYRAVAASRDLDPREQAKKSSDHTCLVAGTMVTTSRGQVPIEEVRIGDQVITRMGWKPVIDHALTKLDVEVVRMKLSNGEHLIGTSDHRVATPDGWQEMGSRPDTVLTWNRTGRPLSGRPSIDVRAECGKSPSDRSLPVITSTTTTETGVTTRRLTFAVSRLLTTLGFTGRNGRSTSATVRSVESSTPRRSSESLIGSVPTDANPGGVGGMAGMTLSELVPVVGTHTAPTGTGPLDLVPASVVSVCAEPQRQDVYDLTVADAHEFLANGILVANCDAIRYGLVHVFRLGYRANGVATTMLLNIQKASGQAPIGELVGLATAIDRLGGPITLDPPVTAEGMVF